MSKKLLSLILLAGFWGASQAQQQPTRNILFVGNSLTYFYGMPTTVGQKANAAGERVFVDQHTVGNTGFAHHHVNAELFAKIRSRTWDFVILQPGSYETYGQPAASVVNTYLSKIKDSILHYSPCAYIMLYEISNGFNGTRPADITEYQNVQGQFLKNIRVLADLAKIPFSPAGEVVRSLALDHKLMLWEGYGDIHPNEYGAYAITCAMYSSIFRKPVSGMPLEPLRWAKDLDRDIAALIQRVSDSVVLGVSPDSWRQGVYKPFASFSVSYIDGDVVQFANFSMGYDKLEWQFPDGTTSDAVNPSHKLFTTGDEETVYLKAFRGDCFHLSRKTVNRGRDATGIPDTRQDWEVAVYPNPAKDRFTISGNIVVPAPFGISLVNVSGQTVHASSGTHTGGDFSYTVETGSLPAGLYVLRIRMGNDILTHKLTIQ